MDKVLRYGLQVFYYTLFMLVVWYFSIMPPYHQLDDDQSVITLSFTHATRTREACRKVTQEELLKLAPNMRLSMDCPRARSPLKIELYLDDQLYIEETLEPPGFHNDQNVNIFKRIEVKAGEHKLRVWMNDDINIEGITHQHEQIVTLKPAQQLLIDFDSGPGSFFTN